MATTQRPEGLQAWMSLCEVVDTVRTALNRDLQGEVGLTLAENLLLCQVAMAADGGLRMVDIAALLHVGKSAVTKTVDRLEQRGLLTRERDGADRRTVYARLTEPGRAAFAAAQPAFVRSVDRHFAAWLNRTELRGLRELSSDLLEHRGG